VSDQEQELIAPVQQVLLDSVYDAGELLLSFAGQLINPRRKEDPSSIVCDADLASEKCIIDRIRARFPDHNIISEERGRDWQASDYTWVIDPLDGTSNFVAGLPWFGVQIGVLRAGKPLVAAMFLPVEKALYFAQAAGGAFRNNQSVAVTSEGDPQNVLCAFGFDPAPTGRSRNAIELLFRVSQKVRNTRATNSLVDFCYTIDGRFGACINLKTKIWDIVPVSLILPAAGGILTDLAGNDLVFQLDEQAGQLDYAVLGASRELHAKMLASLA
jgi:myo-inositol-1(or 4)-monophosphatase